MNNLTNQEMYDTIKEGVKQAFIEKLDHIDIDDAIEMGVWSVFNSRVPDKDVLLDIIFDAVRQANIK